MIYIYIYNYTRSFRNRTAQLRSGMCPRSKTYNLQTYFLVSKYLMLKQFAAPRQCPITSPCQILNWGFISGQFSSPACESKSEDWCRCCQGRTRTSRACHLDLSMECFPLCVNWVNQLLHVTYVTYLQYIYCIYTHSIYNAVHYILYIWSICLSP